MSARKTPMPTPEPERVNGIVFNVQMTWGPTEVIGVAFEHLGRTWAAHHPAGPNRSLYPVWVVSDVASGRSVRGVQAGSCAAARDDAIKAIDAFDPDVRARAFAQMPQLERRRPRAIASTA